MSLNRTIGPRRGVTSIAAVTGFLPSPSSRSSLSSPPSQVIHITACIHAICCATCHFEGSSCITKHTFSRWGLAGPG